MNITFHVDDEDLRMAEWLLEDFLSKPAAGQRAFEVAVMLLAEVLGGERPYSKDDPQLIEKEVYLTAGGLGAMAIVKVLLGGICEHELTRGDCSVCSTRVLDKHTAGAILVKQPSKGA